MEKSTGQKSAIVIGAGAGGIATAARLAKAGFRVTVLEKNDFSGGRCSLIHHEGYRFDQGPSLLLLPSLFHELFQDLGTSIAAEGVKLVKCEPNYNIWFGDGESFELSSDLSKLKLEIEKWEGQEGFERFFGFLEESHRHYEVSMEHVMHEDFPTIFSLLRPRFLYQLYNLHPFESIYNRVSKYFWTERLRRVFTFASMYMGMSPFEAPGTYSLLQYTELAEGIWYPIGGFHKVLEALIGIGERFGVSYRYSTTVSSIKTSSDGRNASGVKLSSGEELYADVVVCNADLVYSYSNLLPPSSYSESLQKRRTSCSSLSFYWTVDRIIPELKAHNIFLADEYRESFDNIFKKQTLPEQPSFYVNVPSRVDPSAAPAGKDTIVVLCPIGHLLESKADKGLNPDGKQDWDAMVKKARDTIFKTMESRIGVSIAAHITHEMINTPQTWKEKFNLDKGAILGISHSFFNVLCFRPKIKHPTIKNLYFVGASTHPGTGVPVVLAGSKITAEKVLKDQNMPYAWPEYVGKGPQERQSNIDKVQRGPPFGLLITLLAVYVAILAAVMYERGQIPAWELRRKH